MRELKKVKEELEKLPDDAEIYQNIGHVLVKVKKEDALKDIEDKLDLLEIRLSSLRKQEEIVRKEIEKLKAELQKYLGGAQVGGGGG